MICFIDFKCYSEIVVSWSFSFFVKLILDVADSYAKIASCLEKSAAQETERDVQKLLARGADLFEKLKKLEARVGTDEELKLSDTLRYYMKDTQAAKDLLYRRMRCLANYEAANKNLERARGRNKDVPKAEAEQSEACKKFEEISEVAKGELQDLKKRRLAAFKKNLIDLADLEVKHAKVPFHSRELNVSAVKLRTHSPFFSA
ncbi:unnamed protein product [Toxocara canis]|uniref:Vps5 domain-containing protein n=1 Tax=Toxocara canis TaxID=6265 RepID=A0A183UJW9_TOXCA|nr:unnamed protein product [Toxocara canis]